jgi:methylenetetrahydrofolate reductase (NADPH)
MGVATVAPNSSVISDGAAASGQPVRPERSAPSASTTARTKTVRDLLATGRTAYSFEFFPPKTDEGERQLWQAIRELEPLQPTFVSVTYGAGGSTRERTLRVVERIASETSITPVAHLTAVGHSRADLRNIIGSLAGAGVRNILALRGDMPGGPTEKWEAHPEGLSYASELVELVCSLGEFCVGVAAFPEKHPESLDFDSDAQRLAEKFAAGADFAVTQFFFDPDDYFRLRDNVVARGCDKPILPGIMPVTNVKQIQRMAELSGAAFPEALAARLQQVADDPVAVREIGVEVASEMCQKLIDGGAPGVHFYTLNRSTATREVMANLPR